MNKIQLAIEKKEGGREVKKEGGIRETEENFIQDN